MTRQTLTEKGSETEGEGRGGSRGGRRRSGGGGGGGMRRRAGVGEGRASLGVLGEGEAKRPVKGKPRVVLCTPYCPKDAPIYLLLLGIAIRIR